MESLKRALESIGRMWSTLSATQRVILGAAAVLMVVVLIVSSIGTTPSWVLVPSQGADRAAILKIAHARERRYSSRKPAL